MATPTIAVESAVLQFPKQIPADHISLQELIVAHTKPSESFSLEIN